MSDLMELVNECHPLEAVKSPMFDMLDKALQVKKLGFTKLAANLRDKVLLAEKMQCVAKLRCPVITEEKILAFLRRVAEAYNKEHKLKTPTPSQIEAKDGGGWFGGRPYLSVYTGHMLSQDPKHLRIFQWCETPVDRYEDLPPDHVLARVKEIQSKEIFDMLTIATVEGVHDPLLIGRLNGCDDRFCLAQWGDDIKLDDVI